MKKTYETPTAELREFCVMKGFAAGSGTSPDWDDLEGWSPVVPPKP